MIHNDLHMMPPTTSFALGRDRHQERMDRKYRHARHIFDLSRKFFLFGRDRAIDALRLRRHASPAFSVRHEFTLAGFYQIGIIERM